MLERIAQSGFTLITIIFIVPCFAGRMPVIGHAETTREQIVVATYLDKVEAKLIPRFEFSGVDWPPRRVTLLALKDRRIIELWADDGASGWRHIRDYRIKGMSGRLGPKLLEGDRQVPEGFYRIEWLNPNSRYHLSLKINYPNEFDLLQARLDRRTNIGGDIFIHGKNVSKGCLAVGDNAVEELFVLAGMIGEDAVSVIISPRDFRFKPFSELPRDLPNWSYSLHAEIAKRLEQFPLSEK